MQDHFGADSFEHQVSFVSKIALVLLKMACDSFQHYPNSRTLTDQYCHSLMIKRFYNVSITQTPSHW